MVGLWGEAGINALFAAEPLVPPSSALGPRVEPALSPTIEFDDVHFAYPGGRRAAHDGLSFMVAAGGKNGVVGPSGSGKTSIARLLLRLFHSPTRALRGGRQEFWAPRPPGLARRGA